MSSDRAEIRVLAFDLALVTGWALCDAYDDNFGVVETGIIDAHTRKEPSPLTEGTYVKRLFKFGRALDAVILGKLEYIHRQEQQRPVDYIAYESTSWRAGKGTSSKVREMALKLTGVLLEHLWYMESIGVEIVRVAPQQWQPFVFGDKYKVKQRSAERKKLSIDHCRALGYEAENHHIADAVNLAFYIAKEKLDG